MDLYFLYWHMQYVFLSQHVMIFIGERLIAMKGQYHQTYS